MTTLLPPNRTVLEVELERSLHRVEGIDVDALRRMRDPYRCEMKHLPALAWGRGVDLWYDDWPEWKKRRITSEIYLMKGRKGTLPGMEKYLDYVDGKVVEFIIPPRTVFARKQDAARTQAWMERFAEIRLYPFAIRGSRAITPALKTADVGTASPGRAFARFNAASVNYGRRAVLRDNGIETVLRSFDQIRLNRPVSVPTTTFAITFKGRASDALPGRAIVGRMVAARPRGRLIVLGQGSGFRASAIPAGFSGVDVLNATPIRVNERHAARAWQPVATVSPRVCVGRMIARDSLAPRFIYDSWRLLDRDRAGGSAYQALLPIVGRMVPGLPPYNALLRVDARYRKSGLSSFVGRAIVGRTPAHGPNDRLLRIGAAIFQSRAARDDVWFTTRTHRPIAIADLSFDAPVPFSGMVPILGAMPQ